MKEFPFAVLATTVILIGCQSASEATKAGAANSYDLRGRVVSVDAGKGVVVLDHEDIPGLMKAMKMDFRVEDPTLLEGLKAGDFVQGRLKKSAAGYVITHLEKRAEK